MQIDTEKGKNGVEYSYHFKNRIFDRDTLFVHYYSINFLFVLNSYTKTNSSELVQFRDTIKKEFRTNLINFFKEDSRISFYIKRFANEEELKEFVNREFKKIIGKVYRTKIRVNELIMGINNHDCLADEEDKEFIELYGFDLLVL